MTIRKIFFLLMSIILVTSCTKDDETEPITPLAPVTPDEGNTSTPSDADDLKILSRSYMVKDDVKKTKSTVTVRFNYPVKVNSLNVTEFYPNYTLANNDSAVVIDATIKYGRNYDFSLDVSKKGDSKKWNFNVTTNIYENQWEYDGIVRTVIQDRETETVWMATDSPFRIYRIPMSDPSKATYKEFSQCMNVMALNPYNNQLYVGTTINGYREARIYDLKMHVLNPKTLDEEDSFVVSSITKETTGDDGEITRYPDATPRSLAFTDDGFGIMVMQHYGDSGTDLCYIDSKDGNTLKFNRKCSSECYAQVANNYEKKSLILIKEDTSGPNFLTLSRSNPTPKLYSVHNKYHSDNPLAGGGMVTRIFHHSKPLYYAQSIYSMCLIDYSNDSYSPVVMDDAHGTYAMDVDYLHDNCVLSANTGDMSIKYKDTSTGKITYSAPWTGTPGHGPVTMYHIPSSDMVITIHASWRDSTVITSYDMKHFRP